MEIQKIPMPNPLPCPGGEMDVLFTKNRGKKGFSNKNSRFFEIEILEMLYNSVVNFFADIALAFWNL